MSQQQQVSFVVNQETIELLKELKDRFHVTSNAAVLRRALALAKVASDSAGDDNAVTIINSHNNETQKILLGV